MDAAFHLGVIVYAFFNHLPLVRGTLQASHRAELSFLHKKMQPFGSTLVPDTKNFESPPCSCSCCEVSRRLPDEISLPTNYLKCALPEGLAGSAVQTVEDDMGRVYTVANSCGSRGMDQASSDSAGGACKAVNPLLAATSETDYNRFCFYNCQPHSYEIGTVCVDYGPQEQLAAFDPDGNGKDINISPAIVTDNDVNAYVGIDKPEPAASAVVDVPPADIIHQIDNMKAQSNKIISAQHALQAAEDASRGSLHRFDTSAQGRTVTMSAELVTNGLGIDRGQQSSGTLGSIAGSVHGIFDSHSSLPSGSIASLSDSAASNVLARLSRISQDTITSSHERLQERGLYDDEQYTYAEDFADQPDVGARIYDGHGVADHGELFIPRALGSGLPGAVTPTPCAESKSCVDDMIAHTSILGRGWLEKARLASSEARGHAQDGHNSVGTTG